MSADKYKSDEINELIIAGRMQDAWELAQTIDANLENWPQGIARASAARLARALGAGRLSRALDWLNWKHDRNDPKLYFQALFSRHSYVADSSMIREIESYLADHPELPAAQRADLYAFLGSTQAGLRDFQPAYQNLELALDLSPSDPWIHVMHASTLELADRYAEALEAAKKAIALRPNYAAAVIQCADNFMHLGQDEEAIQLLENAKQNTQNAAFAIRLQAFYSEREDHERALKCLEIVEQRSPLMDKSLKKWIAGRRADFLYMAGDLDGCLEWCDHRGEGFHKRMAENLRLPKARERKRVRLDVPFTRQHSMTCAPATMASLAAYWGRKHEHLDIAEAICHEGTPWHKERNWANEHGFYTLEFRLTHDALVALIDRGVPFTLTTQYATSAHLQACIGYDNRSGVVLLRDPTERHFVEMFFDTLLEQHPFAGPRCMVMIPVEEKNRLEGILFADQAAYDAYHDLLLAFDGNDRFQVGAAISTLRAVGGKSPLVLEGEERVAAWRDDIMARLRANEAQLAIAPTHAATRLEKAWILRRLDRWDDLRAWLEQSIRLPNADPVFTSELGELLMEDARLLPQAELLLAKAVRMRRRDGRVYESLARCRAKQTRHEEAAFLRRIASSLSQSFEPYAKAYFESCCALRRQDEAISFLEDRTKRFGHKDGAPWITLADCLTRLDREKEAAEVLKKGAAIRPEDGSFLLEAGSMMAGWGEPYRSQGVEWMERSRGRTPEQRWLNKTARIASFLGDRNKALRCWRSLVELQPLNVDGWRGLAQCTADELGEDSAIQLLDQATAKYPDQIGLWALKAEWLRGTKRGPLEALDRMLEIAPADIWALRERSARRLEVGQKEAAELDAREAIHLDPWAAASHGMLGKVLQDTGRLADAAESYRAALRLDVDYTYAANKLCELATDKEQYLKELHFIHSEMDRQVSQGGIVPEYQNLAWSRIDPPELLSQLKNFCEQRPDLWETWAALIEQAIRMNLDNEALAAAEQITERFPLLPRVWLELARVRRGMGNSVGEEEATRRAVDLSPGWDEAAREHSQVLEMLGRPNDAVEVLRRTVRHNPLSGANHGFLADTLYRLGRHDEAFECMRVAHELCPFYWWGWEQACKWALDDGRKAEMFAAINRATERHGHNPNWWPIASDSWHMLGESQRKLEAIQSGLALRPSNLDLRDKLAYHYFDEHEYEKALAACAPLESENEAPQNLRGRRAWILIHSGQPAKGVEEMRQLLDENPNYSWGFGELASWFEDREDWKALRDNSIRWLRAAPYHARALACLGLAERKLENPEAAKAAFKRAYANEPGYTFVGRQLIDLQIETKDFDAARQTLSTLRHYANSPWVTCDAAELALKEDRPDDAIDEAATLFNDPTANSDVFGWLAELFRQNSQNNRWHKLLRESFSQSLPNAPGALTAYLQTLPQNRLLNEGRKLICKYPENSPVRIAGWLFIIRYLKQNSGEKILIKWSSNRKSELHKNGKLWNALGDALLSISAPKKGLAWLADWRARPDDVTDHTLLLVSGFHDDHPGNDELHWNAAGEARREGLCRFPDGPNANHLRAGYALYLATQGKYEEAKELLRNFEPDMSVDYYRSMGATARAIIAAAEGNENETRTAITESVAFFVRYSDLGSRRILDRGLRKVASLLPWARGSVSKLRKRWMLAKPTPRDEARKPVVILFVITAYLLLRACEALAEK
jgi:cellulose synthase operon protein C